MRIAAIVFFLWVGVGYAQMMADPNANIAIANPAYKSAHPRIAIDQAHGNIHTVDGLFKPFALLLRDNGLRRPPTGVARFAGLEWLQRGQAVRGTRRPRSVFSSVFSGIGSCEEVGYPA